MVKKYLLTTKETFRVETVEEAEALKLEFKAYAANYGHELVSFSYVKKQVKSRGEIVDEYVICTAVKAFNEAKDPEIPLSEILYIPDTSASMADLYDDTNQDDLYGQQEEL